MSDRALRRNALQCRALTHARADLVTVFSQDRPILLMAPRALAWRPDPLPRVLGRPSPPLHFRHLTSISMTIRPEIPYDNQPDGRSAAVPPLQSIFVHTRVGMTTRCMKRVATGK